VKTLADVFETGLQRRRARAVTWRKADGGLASWSTDELRSRVDALASALVARGMRPGDRAGLLSRNSRQWAVTDYALVTSRLVTVPIYPTLAPDQARFILDDSGARGLFVEDAAQLERLLPALEGSALEWIAVMSDERVEDERAVSWSGLAAKGSAGGALERPTPEDVASILYTSGTTGRPKGVVLTHRNLASNVVQSDAALEISQAGVDQVNLSLLPLSHIFQRIVDYLLFAAGAEIVHCPDAHVAMPFFQEVRPTFFGAVPRIYEKVHAGIMAKIEHASPLHRTLARWALEVGRRHFHAWNRDGACDGRPSSLLRAEHLVADLLVLRRLRELFGGRVDVAMSGGGPLSKDLHEFFRAIGLNLLPGYGLTEASPVLTTNRRRLMKLGSVGPALPGVELRLAADGELLARGDNIMREYYKLPEETAASLVDGWLLTGDLARIDDRGFVFITGRKKELLVLTTGKKVVPVAVEERVARSPLVAQAVLVGDEQKFVAALVWPHLDVLRAACRAAGIEVAGLATAELLARADVRRLVHASIDAACRDLAEFERPKAIALLPRELSLEEDELTPSLKIKRKVVAQKWAGLIAECFAPRGERG
jgi:long-chain acyl-CoA synthetase